MTIEDKICYHSEIRKYLEFTDKQRTTCEDYGCKDCEGKNTDCNGYSLIGKKLLYDIVSYNWARKNYKKHSNSLRQKEQLNIMEV